MRKGLLPAYSHSVRPGVTDEQDPEYIIPLRGSVSPIAQVIRFELIPERLEPGIGLQCVSDGRGEPGAPEKTGDLLLVLRDKGLDFFRREPSDVHAAAPGRIPLICEKQAEHEQYSRRHQEDIRGCLVSVFS